MDADAEPTAADAAPTGARFRDRGLYLPDEDVLVLADLHVGRDAASPLELPVGERADLLDRLADLLAAFDPATVVLAGDLLHAFERVPDGVAETLAAAFETVADAGAEPVAVRGNHDSMLDSVVGPQVPVCEAYRVGDTLVHHGHADPAGVDPQRGDSEGGDSEGIDEQCPGADAVARYVVGHDHPTIEIEGARRPCLLYGPNAYRGADVFVLPAFTRLAPGAVVNGMGAGDFQSPVVTDADALRPVVWDEEAGETLSFPPLGEFRRLL
ncbi:metallophosphoesterase [Halorussus halobius]|uniref:metallophosphoesterase n=1 Tax=Halorussus halobius TaxID=1710537 RepID=UPI001091ECE7|nr:metallophosphoesterase [Halorussus halobius]